MGGGGRGVSHPVLPRGGTTILTWLGYPPVDQIEVCIPPLQPDGVPPLSAGWGTPSIGQMGVPMLISWMGVPPPLARWGYPPPSDGWGYPLPLLTGSCENITSRHPSDAGSKNSAFTVGLRTLFDHIYLYNSRQFGKMFLTVLINKENSKIPSYRHQMYNRRTTYVLLNVVTSICTSNIQLNIKRKTLNMKMQRDTVGQL